MQKATNGLEKSLKKKEKGGGGGGGGRDHGERAQGE